MTDLDALIERLENAWHIYPNRKGELSLFREAAQALTALKAENERQAAELRMAREELGYPSLVSEIARLKEWLTGIADNPDVAGCELAEIARAALASSEGK